jgi:DNA-binding response OmpR family regulator
VVVEDDAPLRALMGRLLRECGYEVSHAADGKELGELMIAMQDRPIDLILLDLMLPGEDGLSLCKSIREVCSVPIIVVSARGQESDRVKGLDTGADDYMAKPFGRSELLARVRAVLRRSEATSIPHEAFAPVRFDFAGWSYYPRRRELYAPSGAQVILTAAEYELLLTLLRNPQRTLSRERLLELSRGRIGETGDRSIDVLVSRLRGKMGGIRKSSSIIHTIRGVGYMLAADVTAV